MLRSLFGCVKLLKGWKYLPMLRAWATVVVNTFGFCVAGNVAFVSAKPSHVSFNEQGQLHALQTPAAEWPDGLKIYRFGGQPFPAEWIERPETLTPTLALTWRNLEQRRIAAELLGWDKIVERLGGRTRDKHPDPEIGELIGVTLPGYQYQQFLRVQCGTGRRFALLVPNHVQTALEANAWTHGRTVGEFIPPEVRT